MNQKLFQCSLSLKTFYIFVTIFLLCNLLYNLFLLEMYLNICFACNFLIINKKFFLLYFELLVVFLNSKKNFVDCPPCSYHSHLLLIRIPSVMCCKDFVFPTLHISYSSIFFEFEATRTCFSMKKKLHL